MHLPAGVAGKCSDPSSHASSAVLQMHWTCVSDVKVLQGAERGVVVPCFASMVLTMGKQQSGVMGLHD